MLASVSTPSATGQHERPRDSIPHAGSEPDCDVCPHPVADHDAIGLRFCRATKNTGTVRGCVCQPL
jgi:hypothetical protein